MKYSFLPITSILALFIVCMSCRDKAAATGHENALVQCWIHSYEEQAEGGTDWYRPCDYKEFGPSHYRRRLVLKENNEAEYLELSPIDAHSMKPGRWEYDKGTKSLRILDAQGNEVWSFMVVSVEADKLELVHPR